MRQLTARYLLLISLSATLAAASTIDVTNNSQVTLGAGDSLIFTLSGGDTSYPGEIEMLLGGMPLAGPVASIPGTSGVYMPGILFSGALESQDGSDSISLTDSNAARLALPTGDIVLTPGSRSGGSYSGPIDLLSAEVTLTAAESSALFSSGEVTIELQNIGAPITFGYPGTSLASDFTASLISRDGGQSVGARVMNVECVRNNAPEPGTIGLLIIGLTVIGARLTRRSR
jgi:hypothetical protein